MLFFLVVINIATFVIFGNDKARAKEGADRVSERTLFFLALVGGSLGALLGMYIFRHKTRHMSFRIGIPAIFILHLLIAGFLFYNNVIL